MPRLRTIRPTSIKGIYSHSIRFLYESGLRELTEDAQQGDTDAAAELVSDLADFIEARETLPEDLRAYFLPRLRQITGTRKEWTQPPPVEGLPKRDRYRVLIDWHRAFENGCDAGEALGLANKPGRPLYPREAESAATEALGLHVAAAIARLRGEEVEHPKQPAIAAVARQWDVSPSRAEKAWQRTRRQLLGERLYLARTLFNYVDPACELPWCHENLTDVPPPLSVLPALFPLNPEDAATAAMRLRFIELAEGQPYSFEVGLEIGDEIVKQQGADLTKILHAVARRRQLRLSVVERAWAETRATLAGWRLTEQRGDPDRLERRQRWVELVLTASAEKPPSVS